MQLTPGDGSAMSPRFSPDGKRLVFLSHRAAVTSGTHNGTAALDLIHWPPADSGVLLCRLLESQPKLEIGIHTHCEINQHHAGFSIGVCSCKIRVHASRRHLAMHLLSITLMKPDLI